MAKEETRRRRLWEVFEEINKGRTYAERAERAKKRESLALKALLQIYFDDRFEWALPDQGPQYTPSQEHNNPNDLERSIKDLRVFLKGHGYDAMPQMRRETKFIQFLEGIDPKDAELLVALIEGNLHKLYPEVKERVVREAFPGLLPEKEK